MRIISCFEGSQAVISGCCEIYHFEDYEISIFFEKVVLDFGSKTLDLPFMCLRNVWFRYIYTETSRQNKSIHSSQSHNDDIIVWWLCSASQLKVEEQKCTNTEWKSAQKTEMLWEENLFRFLFLFWTDSVVSLIYIRVDHQIGSLTRRNRPQFPSSQFLCKINFWSNRSFFAVT